MAIRLYDLAGADGRRFSPNCWRTRMALAHKGLDVETLPTRFTDIAGICGGGQKTVPVIEDSDHLVADSWAIAEYLEETYSDRQSLFGGPIGRAFALFTQGWAVNTLHSAIANLIILDVHNRLDTADRSYFRESRERVFGRPLEAVQAGRDERLPAFRKSLQPLRHVLAQQKWLGGDTALYADYLVFSPLQWARVTSDLGLLEDGDPVAAWFGRCLDLYDGLGRRALSPA